MLKKLQATVIVLFFICISLVILSLVYRLYIGHYLIPRGPWVILYSNTNTTIEVNHRIVHFASNDNSINKIITYWAKESRKDQFAGHLNVVGDTIYTLITVNCNAHEVMFHKQLAFLNSKIKSEKTNQLKFETPPDIMSFLTSHLVCQKTDHSLQWT